MSNLELYKEILIEILKSELMNVDFPNLDVNINEIIEMRCYKALKKIKAVIENDNLEDDECFIKIEEIIRVLESVGSNSGFRHDFI